jgi:hypothetical protein
MIMMGGEPIETIAEQLELAEIRANNPGWRIWRGVTGKLYVWRLKSSPQGLYRVWTIPGAWAAIVAHEREHEPRPRRPLVQAVR